MSLLKITFEKLPTLILRDINTLFDMAFYQLYSSRQNKILKISQTRILQNTYDCVGSSVSLFLRWPSVPPSLEEGKKIIEFFKSSATNPTWNF